VTSSDTPGQPEPSNAISRRKLLIGAGFGVANVALIVKLASTRNESPSKQSPRITVNGERVAPGPPSLADAPTPPPPGHVFDRVISSGRVMDPDTNYDTVANIGIDGSKVTAISTDTLQGKTTIDATGLVVAPGFIDILSYEPNPYGIWFKIADGVTTNLGMHGMFNTAEGFFRQYGSETHRPPTHYGGAFGDPWMRTHDGIPTRAASSVQIDQLTRDVEEGFAKGWIGVDLEPEYTPWVTTDEITALATVAQKHDMPVFFHARYSSPDEPGKDNATALAEILRVAADTGAAVHVDHITSTGGTHTMPQSIATLEQARADGTDVTACMYPYDYWATYLASPRFNPGWQQRFRIGYSDLVVPGTGERLTEATFRKYQAQNKLVAAYAIPDEDVVTGLQTDWIMIGSDAILTPSNNNHPRSTGCFTRVLGRYVRDQGHLSLMQALAKMTILPARRLDKRVPALQTKGRLQIGADADITIFDPATVGDTSTIDNPAQMAKGVEYVLVSGQLVKEHDTLHRDVRPGTPIKPVLT
jgi:cytosine/adenosine deaminase-related metal-dependent hydrolase